MVSLEPWRDRAVLPLIRPTVSGYHSLISIAESAIAFSVFTPYPPYTAIRFGHNELEEAKGSGCANP